MFANPTNFTSEERLALKTATNSWNTCITKDFMPQWMAGESLSIEEVCVDERSQMSELHEAMFGEKPMPFKPNA